MNEQLKRTQKKTFCNAQIWKHQSQVGPSYSLKRDLISNYLFAKSMLQHIIYSRLFYNNYKYKNCAANSRFCS